MITTKQKIEETLALLFKDSKNDPLRMVKRAPRLMFRPPQPEDFKDIYLSISKEEGEALTRLIVDRNLKNIVEFGASFGISTLFMAAGVLETDGHILTTELLPSKAKRAQENFERAGVTDRIELRVGDAMETLKNHEEPIDLLFLDGWKELYEPLFQLLEPQFHENTVVYVDNANMGQAEAFLRNIKHHPDYKVWYVFQGKAAIIERS